jgi:glycosyl transferase family 25
MTNTLLILCINLEKRLDRRESIRRQADLYGLKVQFVKAVEGALNPVESYQRYNRSKRTVLFDDLAPGQIGINESYYNALGLFLDSDHEYVLILEDDAIFPENIKEILDYLTNHTSGWDVIRLQRSRKQTGIKVDKLFGYELICPISVGLLMTACLYTRKGAQKSRKLFESYSVPADYMYKYSHFKGLRVLEVNPAMVTQADELGSDIWIKDLSCKEYKNGVNLVLKLIDIMKGKLGQGIRVFYVPFTKVWYKKN